MACGSAHSVPIINAYLDLQKHLPPGSPGEWYAIYPPFPKGFTMHDKPWQYMNGGVGGHVAGALARGAFENGFEPNARDILDRLTELGRKHGNKIWFAYTGSIPPAPPPPRYRPIDLSASANMDNESRGGPGSFTWMQTTKPGDDIRGLPTAPVQQFAGIDFNVTDPVENGRGTALAISHRSGFQPSADVPIHSQAGAFHPILFHLAARTIGRRPRRWRR